MRNKSYSNDHKSHKLLSTCCNIVTKVLKTNSATFCSIPGTLSTFLFTPLFLQWSNEQTSALAFWNAYNSIRQMYVKWYTSIQASILGQNKQQSQIIVENRIEDLQVPDSLIKDFLHGSSVFGFTSNLQHQKFTRSIKQVSRIKTLYPIIETSRTLNCIQWLELNPKSMKLKHFKKNR